MDEQVKQRRCGLPGWIKTVITVLLTLAITAGVACLVLGRSGIALLEGWFLAKYAFVDTTADLDTAAHEALGALVEGLGDRWSYYLDEEYYQQVTANRANNYVGVGVTVNYEDERGLLVQDVTVGGPAEAAGVQVGDLIVAVDGVSIAGEARYSGGDMIRGEVNTQVV